MPHPPRRPALHSRDTLEPPRGATPITPGNLQPLPSSTPSQASWYLFFFSILPSQGHGTVSMVPTAPTSCSVGAAAVPARANGNEDGSSLPERCGSLEQTWVIPPAPLPHPYPHPHPVSKCKLGPGTTTTCGDLPSSLPSLRVRQAGRGGGCPAPSTVAAAGAWHRKPGNSQGAARA